MHLSFLPPRLVCLWRAHEASGLLLSIGLLLAINVSAGKVGVENGVAPVELAFVASAGAGLLLLAINIRGRCPPPLDRRHLLAYAALGIVSFGIPAALGAVVASRIGVGLTSVLNALSPILTLALAATFRMERLRPRLVAGLLLGFLGTVILLSSGSVQSAGFSWSGTSVWMLAGLVIPLANATGNILRTLLVPAGTPGRVMVPGVLLAAACVSFPLVVATASARTYSGAALTAMILSVATMALATPAIYRLQSVAGPVKLSQIGYVAAAFGVALSAAVFGEALSIKLAVAAVLIVAGVRLVSGAPRPIVSSAHPD